MKTRTTAASLLPMPREVLLWMQEGPYLRFDGDTFYIDDLNPEVSIRWKLSRWEVLRLGCRCMLAAAFALR